MNRKSALMVMVMEVKATVPNFLNLSSTSGATTMSPIYSYSYLIMPAMWNFIWLKNCLWM